MNQSGFATIERNRKKTAGIGAVKELKERGENHKTHKMHK